MNLKHRYCLIKDNARIEEVCIILTRIESYQCLVHHLFQKVTLFNQGHVLGKKSNFLIKLINTNRFIQWITYRFQWLLWGISLLLTMSQVLHRMWLCDFVPSHSKASPMLFSHLRNFNLLYLLSTQSNTGLHSLCLISNLRNYDFWGVSSISDKNHLCSRTYQLIKVR